ncbi:MAG: hypothetical protein WCG91_03835 [Candidatus Shapirobacteria bacterium]
MFKIIGNTGKKLLNSRGIIQLPIIIGLVILAIALPLVANLVQKNTENRSKAVDINAAKSVCSGICTVAVNTTLIGGGPVAWAIGAGFNPAQNCPSICAPLVDAGCAGFDAAKPITGTVCYIKCKTIFPINLVDGLCTTICNGIYDTLKCTSQPPLPPPTTNKDCAYGGNKYTNGQKFCSGSRSYSCSNGTVTMATDCASNANKGGTCTGAGKCVSGKVVATNGVCDNTVKDKCVKGRFGDVTDTATHYKWVCMGAGSGTADNCSLIKGAITTKTNGNCGTKKDDCDKGIFSDVADNTTQYKWNCKGINGGKTDNCSLSTTAPPPTKKDGVGDSCGNSGTCIDTLKTPCTGTNKELKAGLCPGPAEVKCCQTKVSSNPIVVNPVVVTPDKCGSTTEYGKCDSGKYYDVPKNSKTEWKCGSKVCKLAAKPTAKVPTETCTGNCYDTKVGSPAKLPTACTGYNAFYNDATYAAASGTCSTGNICCKRTEIKKDAVCGSYNGANYSSSMKTSTDKIAFCKTGDLYTPADTGSEVQWTCTGVNGGKDVSCKTNGGLNACPTISDTCKSNSDWDCNSEVIDINDFLAWKEKFNNGCAVINDFLAWKEKYNATSDN